MDWIYDVETFPNCFLLTMWPDADREWHTGWGQLTFEVSDRRDDLKAIRETIDAIRREGHRMVGFNSLNFDYPILHMLLTSNPVYPESLYKKAEAIIAWGKLPEKDRGFSPHAVRQSEWYIEQIDLFKIHHFDNLAKATSLKTLQFNMRAPSIQDLPFEPGTVLTHDQMDTLVKYNQHDVEWTRYLYEDSLPMIEFREQLTKTLGRNFMNFNDTKIGKEFFIMELEKSGVRCFELSKAGRKPVQTKRTSINLDKAIFPWIGFEDKDLNRVLTYLRSKTISETKAVLKGLSATVNGFTFDFGTGGIHGSVKQEMVVAEKGTQIIDLDVSSYYPNLAIRNRLHPHHLGSRFCDIYKHLYEQRKQYAKGSPENLMLKLALNGVYGDSNNPHSPFYDPLFTMQITLNGQLLICMLAEQLMKIPSIRMIQVNTDGLTVKVSDEDVQNVSNVCLCWEMLTGMSLERANYERMAIMDVSNYIAKTVDGTIKRKGCYNYEKAHHEDHSSLVVPKVAEQVILFGGTIGGLVRSWKDEMDFMLRVKVPRTGYLEFESERIQNVTRFYVAKKGGKLTKWLPPLAGKDEWRSTSICAGWLTTPCNELPDQFDIDYDYYIQEVEKIVLPLK